MGILGFDPYKTNNNLNPTQKHIIDNRNKQDERIKEENEKKKENEKKGD